MKTIKEKLQLWFFMQDLDELKHVFLICAEFEVKRKQQAAFIKKTF